MAKLDRLTQELQRILLIDHDHCPPDPNAHAAIAAVPHCPMITSNTAPTMQ
jgi:hypothetical protein